MAVDQPLPPARGREAGECQPEPKARGSLSPRDGILHQIVSWIPVANQVFLGSCMVDICQEGCSQRSAPQRRHNSPEMALPLYTQETKWLGLRR